MKTYIGRRTDTGVVVEVVVNNRKRKLRHIPFHSPDGFEWGYGGSGPADLALAILVDHLRERPPATGWQTARQFDQWTVHSTAWQLHQVFKHDFIAQYNIAWILHSQEIDAWLKEQEVKHEDNGS